MYHAILIPKGHATLAFGADHVHLNLEVPPSKNLKDIVTGLKHVITIYIRTRHPEIYKRVQPLTDEDIKPKDKTIKVRVSDRFWQVGYGAQAFGNVDQERVEKYISGQLAKEREALGLTGGREADRKREELAKKETKNRFKACQLEKHAGELRRKFLMSIEQNPRAYVYTGGGEPSVLVKVFEEQDGGVRAVGLIPCSCRMGDGICR